MATAGSALDRLVEHPDFATLSDSEKRYLIDKVRGGQGSVGGPGRAQAGSGAGQAPQAVTGNSVLPGGLAAPPAPNQAAASAAQVRPVAGPPAGPASGGPSGYLFGNAQSAPEAQGNIIDTLRNIIPPLAGAAGSAGGAFGSMGAFVGSDALLKQLKPGNKESIPQSLQDSLVNAAVNEAGAKVIGGLWKAGKAFTSADQPEILKFLPTASQALKAEGKFPTTASILKYVEDHFAPGAKAAAQEASGAAGSQLGAKLAAKEAGYPVLSVKDPKPMLDYLNKEAMPYLKDPATIASLDKVFDNPAEVQGILTRAQQGGAGSTAARNTLAGARLSRIQQEATQVQPDGGVRLDSQKLFSLLDDPAKAETNTKLFGSNANLSNVRQFYKNIAATQDKAVGFGGFGKLRLAAEGIALTGGLARSLVTMNPLPAFLSAAPIAIEVGLSGLAKTLTSPKTARLMLSLANNEALGVSDQYAARQLMQTLKGAAVNLVGADGSKTPAKIQDGQFVPAN